MIGVQVTDEQLVEVVVGDLHGGDALGGAETDVEDELVAVAQLDDPAGRRLLRSGIGHAGTAGDDPHLVRRQVFGAGIVDIPVSQCRCRRDLRCCVLCQDLRWGEQVGSIGGPTQNERQHDNSYKHELPTCLHGFLLGISSTMG